MPVPGTLFLGIQAFTVMVQFAFLKVLRMRPNAVEMRKQPKQRKKKNLKKLQRREHPWEPQHFKERFSASKKRILQTV